MKYQLVVQLPEEVFGDLDKIIEMEDKLLENLLNAELDGHDVGSGEVNLFIHTNNPIDTFGLIKNIFIYDEEILRNAKVAYRDLTGEEYTLLWPEGLKEFKII